MQHAHDIGEGEGRSYNEMVQDLVEVNVRDVSLFLKQLQGSKLISEFAGSGTECQGESAEEPDTQSIGRVESSSSACCPGHGRSECSQKTSNHLLGQNGKYPIEEIMNSTIHKDFGNLTSQIKPQNISIEN